MIFKKLLKFNTLYNKIFSWKFEHKIEKITVFVSIALFLIHIFLIFLAKNFEFEFLNGFSEYSYIAAVSTPFTVFLFFELFQMILTIPRSIPEAVGKQFEVITIVLIRNIFKEISHIDNLSELSTQTEVLSKVAIDITFAVVCFAFVLFYLNTLSKLFKRKNVNYVNFKYVSLKKFLTVVMIIVSIGLLLLNIFNGANIFYNGGFDVFFQEVFTVFIFIDILILLLSLILVDEYELIFTNAALIISTIIVRLTFTAEFPLNNFTAFGGILFGVAVIYIYYINVCNTKLNRYI